MRFTSVTTSLVSSMYFFALISLCLTTNGTFIHNLRTYQSLTLTGCCNGSTSKTKWTFEDEILFHRGFVVNPVLGDTIEILPNNSLHLKNVSVVNEGIYVCNCSSNGHVITHQVILEVEVQVQLSINGQHSTDHGTTIITDSDTIMAICQTKKSKIPVTFTWLINGKTVDWFNGTIVSNTVEDEGHMFTYKTALSFHYTMREGNVTCLANGSWNQILHSHFVVSRTEEAVTDTKADFSQGMVSENDSNFLLTITVAAVIIVLISISALLFWKLHDSRQKRMNNIREKELLSLKSHDCDTSKSDKYPSAKSRLQLPELPGNDEGEGYVAMDENGENEEIYDLPGKGREDKKMISIHDLYLIHKMKMGMIHTRWMGTMKLPSGENKCVVATTLNDKVNHFKERNWEDYVKRVLEVPENHGLVTVEGLCVDKGQIILLHVHLNCKTLNDLIQNGLKGGSDEDETETSADMKVSRLVNDILEGMELIHSYGFLHPGLSTRKVLVTERGICKLYDFCLKEDARHTVITRKEQRMFSDHTTPPEVLSRSEYNSASDVWYTALVIWEIIAPGSSPFVFENMMALATSQKKMAFKKWPSQYEGIRNDVLYDCWSDDSYMRPNMSRLRSSFLKIFDPSVESSYDPSCQDGLGYETMKDMNLYESRLDEVSYQIP